MKGNKELFFYVTVSCGMALATSVFTMISGLFTLTAGPGAVAGIVIAGGFCIIIALSLGELASMYPSAPAVRTYLKTAFGPQVSLLIVYLYLISVIMIAGLESFIFSQVFHAVFPAARALPIVFVLLAAVTAINFIGLELPRSLQMAATVIVVSFIAVSGIVGIVFAKPVAVSHPAVFGADFWQSLPAASGMAVFLFMGFEWVAPVGLRAKSYHWKVPVSLPISVSVLSVIFILFVMGASAQMSPPAISGTPVPQVPYMIAIYGHSGGYLALGLALLATVSTFNAGILGGARLIYMLAREGNLPAWCATLSPERGTPAGAIWLLSGLALLSAIGVMIWKAQLLTAVLGAAIICILYASFLLSALVLRKRRPEMARPFRTRVWKPLQYLGVVTLPIMAVLVLSSEPSLGLIPLYAGIAVLAIASFFTLIYGRPSRRTTAKVTASQASDVPAEQSAP